MIAQAVSVTAFLAVASLLTRFSGETDASTLNAAVDLVYAAMQWREAAVQDNDPTLRLQHNSMAAALVQAARSMVRDDALEQRVGVSMSRLARSVERRVAESRQSIRPSAGVVAA